MVQEYRSAKEVFDYDDIMLVPGKCVVKSRSEVNVSTFFGKETFKLPIVPANMSTIVDENTALWLANRGYFYVMHRFDVDSVEFTKAMHEADEISSISLGIKPADYEILERFRREEISPDYITVDVAHGDSEEVIRMVKTIRSLFSTVFIIAGNIATVEGAQRLADAGANAVKVGIGPGCFVPDSKVLTKNGLRRIQDIQPGEWVLTHKSRYREVKHKFEFSHHIETILINGIECTPDHEFYVCDKENLSKVTDTNYTDFCYWVPAHELDSETQKIVRITS